MTAPVPHPELLIARHGEAHCNIAGIIAGPSCTGLTSRGRDMAAALGKRLAAEAPVTAIHASTTPRARETADIIAEALHLPVTGQHDLRVPDPGTAEGLTWAEARAAGTDPDNPVRPASASAETWAAYLARASACLQTILDDLTGRVLVVGHSETLTAAFHLLLGVDTLGRLKLALDHTAVTTLRPVREYAGVVVEQRWQLVQHNDVTHLNQRA
ncbi:histidine phosphatase family protein [Planosporangium sp. 12N6]|uniref:histidine phosphatase family protein n=1 Tax=Planosporangium spinosum TaxID=3402278 RepID=UPI003CEB16A7